MTEFSDNASPSPMDMDDENGDSNRQNAPVELTVKTSTPTTSSGVSSNASSPIRDEEFRYQQFQAKSIVDDHSETRDRKSESVSSRAETERVDAPTSPLTFSDGEIKAGARFLSFTDFERVFESWKAEKFHPFRVASSETLRLSDGSANAVFKYRYIVYHCAHYGAPRMRGIGKRPNQNYMPCGCRAMLRLNYSWSENALRVTTLCVDHNGHDATKDAYYKFAAKVKQRQSASPPAAGQPTSRCSSGKRPRSESPYTITSKLLDAKPCVKTEQHQNDAPLNLSNKNRAEAPPQQQHLQHHLQHQQQKRQQLQQPVLVENEPYTQNVLPAFSTLSSILSANSSPVPNALSAFMYNQQQQSQQQLQNQQQQQAVALQFLRSLAVFNGAASLATAAATTEADRQRAASSLLRELTQYLSMARGGELDDKLSDLKLILKKWQLGPNQQQHVIRTPSYGVSTNPSSVAAAAAMMVQAMSNGGGCVSGVPANFVRNATTGDAGKTLIANGGGGGNVRKNGF